MSAAALLSVASAVSGAIGTVMLFFGTFGYEVAPGAAFDGQAVSSIVAARNARRHVFQRCGLSLLLLCFVLQGISAFA